MLWELIYVKGLAMPDNPLGTVPMSYEEMVAYEAVIVAYNLK